MGKAILWLGGDDVSIVTAIPGISCSSSELLSVYSTRLQFAMLVGVDKPSNVERLGFIIKFLFTAFVFALIN